MKGSGIVLLLSLNIIDIVNLLDTYTHISIKKLTNYHNTETPGVCFQRMPCITNTQSKHHHHLQKLTNEGTHYLF